MTKKESLITLSPCQFVLLQSLKAVVTVVTPVVTPLVARRRRAAHVAAVGPYDDFRLALRCLVVSDVRLLIGLKVVEVVVVFVVVVPDSVAT